MFKVVERETQSAIIKVIGVGGGGGNAVEHMVRQGVAGVEFICANTDAQALENHSAGTLLQLGCEVTKGLGAGANPDVGKQAALENRDLLADALAGADMVFITAGMGGGTGTGAAPIVAEVAREQGALAVAVVTKPFLFEGRKRIKVAEEGIHELSANVDSLIAIPNEKLLAVVGEDTPLVEAFAEVDDVLSSGVRGIADVIIRPGKINVDFADVRTVMQERGMAMMGRGAATGDNRAEEATLGAIHSPLLEDIDFTGARGVLVNVTAGTDISLGEFSTVGDTVHEFASDSAQVVVGTVIDDDIRDEIRVTVVATGLGGVAEERPAPKAVTENWKRVAGDGVQDYSGFDSPTVIRNEQTDERPLTGVPGDYDLLDVPAFLRRQAD